MSLTLTRALDAVLDGADQQALRRATDRLVSTYRSGTAPTEPVLRDPVSAAAYAAYRMPATHAAVARALRWGLGPSPEPAIRSLVDVGGGTGAAAWAVAEAIPALEAVDVIDASADALALGRRIARHGPPPLAAARWTRVRIGAGTELPPADLVTVSYLLGELDDGLRSSTVDAAAAAANHLLLVVEPGTPRGFRAVLDARDRLVGAGWHLLAPCPQPGPCPVAARPGDWCHVPARLDRTALHRRLKGAERGHEDEKLSYVLASRAPGAPAAGRVVRHPVRRKGVVELEVCRADGTVGAETVSKRDRERYRAARDAAWGSAFPPSDGS